MNKQLNTLIKKIALGGLGIVIVGAISWQFFIQAKLNEESELFVHGNGRIEATDIDIATKYAGRIVDIFVREGDFVKKDQLLAQMQVNVLNAQLDEAKAQLQQAKSVVASAQAQVAVRESDVAAAKALVVKAESELDNRKRNLARTQDLVKKGTAAIEKLDNDTAALRIAQASLSAAKAQVKAAQAAVVAAQAQVIGAQATVESVIATIARIKANIDDSQLKAPRNGRVQYRVAEPGEVLPAGGKVLNMVDLSDVYMTFFLPETVAGRVAIGDEVHIILDAAPQYVIPANVSFVASVAQFTPKTVETANERQKLMFRVKARIDEDLLNKHLTQVKTGLPGVAWLKLDPKASWPINLTIRVPE
jgi:HlyD family secretion protein